MRLLLDTHVFLWAVAGSRLLKPAARQELPVKASRAAGVAKLQLHHSDPFDRLLLAQAVAEPLRLLTADATLAPYSDVVMLI